MRTAIEIRDRIAKDTLLFGNGDVRNIQEAWQKVNGLLNLASISNASLEYNCDGVMIGRGIFGNPFLFAEVQPTTLVRLSVLQEHCHLFTELLLKPRRKKWLSMRRHFNSYLRLALNEQGLKDSKDIRDVIPTCTARTHTAGNTRSRGCRPSA
jgi:tRNA-dihydrouridine synthase